MASNTSWINSLSKILETVVKTAGGVIQSYATVIIAQAQRGFFDTQKAMVNAEIDVVQNSLKEQQNVKEINARITSINGKISNGLNITADDYYFMVNNGYTLAGYTIDDNGNVIKYDTNGNVTSTDNRQLAGLSTTGYITLGGLIIGGWLLIKKIFGR